MILMQLLMHRVSNVLKMRDLTNKYYITANFVFFKFLYNIFLQKNISDKKKTKFLYKQIYSFFNVKR